MRLHGRQVQFIKCSNEICFQWNNIQLSPEGEVDSGYIPRRVEVYIPRSSPTLMEIVVLVFTKSDGQKNAASLMATVYSSETFAKRRAIFLSVRKTVNIQVKLREPINTRENCYPLIW